MLNVSMDVSSGADFAGVGGLLGPPRVTALGGLSGRLYAQPVITIYGVCCACKTLPVVYRPTSIHRVTHRLASGVALMCSRPLHWAHAGGGAGELPAGRRHRDRARSAAALHGRGCRIGPLKNPARIAGFDTQERWQSGRMYLTRNQA